MRQLSIEQLETYERQRAAAEKLRTLNEAQAQAAMQTQLTNSRVQVQIAESQGEADLARARKQAEQTVVNAEAELARSREQAEQVVVEADAELAHARRQAEQTVVTAEAESQQRMLAGRGEAQRVMQVGLSEASVLMRKIASFGDPRLYALSIVAEQLTHSSQPLVPERVFMAGGDGDRPSVRRPRHAGHAAQPAGGREVGLPAGGCHRAERPQGVERAPDARGGGVDAAGVGGADGRRWREVIRGERPA